MLSSPREGITKLSFKFWKSNQVQLFIVYDFLWLFRVVITEKNGGLHLVTPGSPSD